jgi:parallel beta-helix repeat protein
MFRQVAAAVLVFTFMACGGSGPSGGSTASAPTPAGVAVSPTLAEVDPGSSLALTATVSGATTSKLTWSVDNIANGDATVGTISGSGSNVTYTAPPAEGTHLLVATSSATTDTKTNSGSTQIHVRNKSVSIVLTPSTATVNGGATQSFTATVSGSTNTAVDWSVDGVANGDATVGTVTGSGATITYTAPASSGTHTLTATSQANLAKSDTSTITVQGSTSTPTVSVALTPGSVSLPTGGIQSFVATVSGSTNTAVTWMVDGVANGNSTVGTITGTGDTVTYTAPSASGNHSVAAKSQADTTKSASSAVTVSTTAAVSVALSPGTASLTTGAAKSFVATVSGSTNTAVTWTVDGIANGNSTVGTITGTGTTVTYTAPTSAGNHSVAAKSQADTTKSASAAVTVSAPTSVSVVVGPGTASLAPGATQAFTATVSGSTNTAVNWSVDGIANGNSTVGTLIGTGNTVTYTAPAATGSHSVAAVSQADTTKASSATVTISSGCAPAPTSSTVVNVKDLAYGAKGDGVTDDTAAIQRAVNAVAGTGGTVSVPDGTYMINALTSVLLKSNMTFSMSSGAVLKAITNSSSNYSILFANGVNHVNITGGTILGERSTHTGTGGEWGFGVRITGSQQIVVEKVLAKDCWGDGFYVSASASITLCNVTADHNRRQGLTITSVDGMVVRNSTFKNTQGTLPEDGIDIEPNAGETVNNVLITGCTFTSNSGFGVEIGVPISYTGQAWIKGVVVDGNTVTGSGVNSLSTSPRAGIEASDIPGAGNTITNNYCAKNGLGILLRNGSNGMTISGNTVTQNTTDGIQVYSTDGNTITGNTATNNLGRGIYSTSNTNITLNNNTVSGNGVAP